MFLSFKTRALAGHSLTLPAERKCGARAVFPAVILSAIFMTTACEPKKQENDGQVSQKSTSVSEEPSSPDNDPEQETKTPTEKKKLDLSIPETTTAPVMGERQAGLEDGKLLPDLFEEKNKKLKVDGGLIIKEEFQHYREAVDGAEVGVEVKIK